MEQAISFGAIIAILMFAYYGRDVFKNIISNYEKDIKAEQAQASVERAEKVQETNKELERLLADNDGQLVSADYIIDTCNGSSKKKDTKEG